MTFSHVVFIEADNYWAVAGMMNIDTSPCKETPTIFSKWPGPICNISLITLLLMAGFISGCSSMASNSDSADSYKPKESSAYKINIINASNTTINDIRFKPCNSQSSEYLQLTDNLRPMEKFTINLYSQCVDLVARNAFKKKLVDVKNVDLQSMKTWTIR